MKADDILGLKDRRTRTITVKEWGRDITIQELGLRSGLEAFSANESGGQVVAEAEDVAKIVARSVVDDEGNRIFSDDHIPKLLEKNMKALVFIYQQVLELSASGDAEKN